MTLKERFDQLEPREQRLLGILVAVFVVMAVLLVPVLVAAMVSSRAEDNALIREAIERIHDERDRIAARDSDKKALDKHYEKPAPPLAGFLDKLATEGGVEIPESQDRPVVPHGKKFEERSTKLVLKKIGMLALVRFLEKIENSGYPVRVSSLNIRKRPTDEDSFDVNVIVSAFDRKAPEKTAPKDEEGSDEGEDGEEEKEE